MILCGWQVGSNIQRNILPPSSGQIMPYKIQYVPLHVSTHQQDHNVFILLHKYQSARCWFTQQLQAVQLHHCCLSTDCTFMSKSDIQSWEWMVQIIIIYGCAFYTYVYNIMINGKLGKE